MSVLDIVLIIIGFMLVVISYYISDKFTPDNSGQDIAAITEIWGEKEEATIKERIKSIVSDKSEEMIDNIDDRLCHLSNDKIMEFKEYTDQVMENVKEEHKHAVFLYNMLNEKEESTKKLLNEIDKKYAELSDKLNELREKAEEKDAGENIKNVNTEKKTTGRASRKRSGQTAKAAQKQSDSGEEREDIPEKDEKAGPGRNDRILELWKQGESVLDISRQLGIGQGEVKLVIDLFKGV